MNELYAESSVKRKETTGTLALRVVLILIAIVSFLLSGQNSILFLIAALVIIAIVYIFPRLNIEYEYVYCDGQIDFDKIMGKARRKNAMKIDFEQVEIMAPQGSHSLDGYTYLKTKEKDFSSKNKEVKPYVIVVRKGEEKTKILFEPNENMIHCIKSKYPRKVVEY